MIEKTNSILRLDKIQHIAQLSSGKAKLLMETCVWSLCFCKHSNGVKLSLDYEDRNILYNIEWSDDEVDHEAVNRSYNQDDAIEHGAEAIAILISIDQTSFNSVERSITSTGIDYWLGYKNKNPDHPFQRATRLEISGILKESKTNTVNRRIKGKIDQTKPSHYTGLPVLVVVVEFSQPHARMVSQNVNS